MDQVYEFEPKIADLFREVIDRPVMSDPRSDDNEDLKLGFPFKVIRDEVLEKGLGDFRSGRSHPEFGSLTAEERALLYAFVNMKVHYFQCLAALDQGRPHLEDVVQEKSRGLVIDIGCGPGTAGLAIAARYPSSTWDYIGIDHAPAMRDLATRILSAARSRGYVGSANQVSMLESWEGLPRPEVLAGRPILVMCSYFFASHSLNYKTLSSLAAVLGAIRMAPGRAPLALSYVNSTNELATRNYDLFLQLLGLKPDESPAKVVRIHYRTRPGQNPRQTPDFAVQTIRL
jgi:SAM-dependent methyltransferase